MDVKALLAVAPLCWLACGPSRETTPGESGGVTSSSSATSGGGGDSSSGGGGSSSTTSGSGGTSAGGAPPDGGASAGSGGDPVPTACGGVTDAFVGPYVGWFEDITASTGIDAVGAGLAQTAAGNGVAVADIDGDGQLDLAVTTGIDGPTLLYRNKGDSKFEDVTALAEIPFASGTGVSFGDLDNDGDPDLIVSGQGLVAVYENLDGVRFADDTAASGLTSSIGPVNGSVLGDIDSDGLLDLYFFDGDGNRMFRNLGAFQFEDVTTTYGLQFVGGSKSWTGSMWDCDSDGKLDIHVGRDTGVDDPGFGEEPPNWEGDKLFRNTGVHASGIYFDEMGDAAGIGKPRSSMGDVIADFDGDGRFDLYVSNTGKNPLFLAQGDGTFVEGADGLGVGAIRRLNELCPADSTSRDCLLMSWGTALFDVDHDGVDDLVVVNGKIGGLKAEQPSRQYRGKAGGGFEPVETALGCMNARGLVPADLDGDGDLDLLITTIVGPVRVFRNNAPENQGWLRVRLEGSSSNRDGAGAVVIAKLSGGRTLQRAVGVGGIIFSSAPTEAHLTTGGEAIVALDVRWPSGALQHMGPVALNQTITVAEP